MVSQPEHLPVEQETKKRASSPTVAHHTALPSNLYDAGTTNVIVIVNQTDDCSGIQKYVQQALRGGNIASENTTPSSRTSQDKHENTGLKKAHDDDGGEYLDLSGLVGTSKEAPDGNNTFYT